MTAKRIATLRRQLAAGKTPTLTAKDLAGLLDAAEEFRRLDKRIARVERQVAKRTRIIERLERLFESRRTRD